jgi:hypothetical protein
MKAIEFGTRVEENQTLSLPADVAAQLLPGQAIRVLLLVNEVDEDDEEDRAWARMGIEAFFSEEDPELDALYNPPEQLPGG